MTDEASQSSLPLAAAVIQSGMENGWHRGAQVYVSRSGQAEIHLAVGESRPGVAMAPDALVLWMSSCKPVGAVAAMQLVERGKIALDDPVVRYIPAFAAGGKEAITLRHLLQHTGGFRWVDIDVLTTDWPQAIEKICAPPIEPGWVPGEKAGYHPGSSWFILGELIRVIDGRAFSRVCARGDFSAAGHGRLLDRHAGRAIHGLWRSSIHHARDQPSGRRTLSV